jgi:hypothetical protein
VHDHPTWFSSWCSPTERVGSTGPPTAPWPRSVQSPSAWWAPSRASLSSQTSLAGSAHEIEFRLSNASAYAGSATSWKTQ